MLRVIHSYDNRPHSLLIPHYYVEACAIGDSAVFPAAEGTIGGGTGAAGTGTCAVKPGATGGGTGAAGIGTCAAEPGDTGSGTGATGIGIGAAGTGTCAVGGTGAAGTGTCTVTPGATGGGTGAAGTGTGDINTDAIGGGTGAVETVSCVADPSATGGNIAIARTGTCAGDEDDDAEVGGGGDGTCAGCTVAGGTEADAVDGDPCAAVQSRLPGELGSFIWMD